jgi:sodium pump decarboxylase gamma subunit
MDIINTGVSVTIIGMGIVFAVLIILWFALEIMRVISDPKSRRQKRPAITITEKPQSLSENQNDDDVELIAVITAAIASMLNKPTSALKVSFIRRVVDNTPEWGKAARKRVF